jgi:hypothetical protein
MMLESPQFIRRRSIRWKFTLGSRHTRGPEDRL